MLSKPQTQDVSANETGGSSDFRLFCFLEERVQDVEEVDESRVGSASSEEERQ